MNSKFQKLTDRAGCLAEFTLRNLRLAHPDNLDGTVSGSQWNGISKSQLISDILFDEFEEEFDEDYEQPDLPSNRAS